MAGVVNETWMDVAGFEGSYRVSSLGRVRSLARTRVGYRGFPVGVRARVLKASCGTNGYLFVILSRNGVNHNRMVHRLVAESFVSRHDDETEVNHIDSDKWNNAASNLEWVTHGENVAHAYRAKRAGLVV